jgi:hypothetical protein
MLKNIGDYWRYILYAVALIGGVGGYLWLGAQDASGPASHASARTDMDMLPALRSLDGAGETATHRDLFAYVEPEKPPVVEAPPPPPAPVEAPPPPQSSQLDSLSVVGLVRRSNSLFVFVQAGGSIKSVALGGKFGENNSLTVSSVQGRDVTIVDTKVDVSKVFTLSEE